MEEVDIHTVSKDQAPNCSLITVGEGYFGKSTREKPGSHRFHQVIKTIITSDGTGQPHMPLAVTTSPTKYLVLLKVFNLDLLMRIQPDTSWLREFLPTNKQPQTKNAWSVQIDVYQERKNQSINWMNEWNAGNSSSLKEIEVTTKISVWSLIGSLIKIKKKQLWKIFLGYSKIFECGVDIR